MASKILNVYQIGDMPVRIHLPSWHGYKVQSRSESKELLFSRDIAFSQSQRLVKPGKIQLSGSILSYADHSVQDYEQQMLSLVGVELDIFAFEIIDCCADIDCCNGCDKGQPDILWLHGRGVLDEVDTQESDETIRMRATLSMSTTWKAINRILWHWVPEKPSVWVTKDNPASAFAAMRPYPFIKDVITSSFCHYGMWQKQRYDNPFLVYDPRFFEGMHGYHRPLYPETGWWRNWSQPNDGYPVLPSREIWSAEPSDIYIFRDMPSTGKITVTVNRHTANQLWGTTRQFSTIDLAEVDTQLAAQGYTGIQSGDIMVAGDTEYKPGIIIRNNEQLNAYVPARYDGEYFGATGLERSQVTVNTPGDTEWACRHDYRRL